MRIIFVDEFQHIIGKETQHIIYKVADFLKDIINHTCIPMILIGRLGFSEPILMVNPQLEGRVGAPLYLEPFQWDRTKPETIAQFCQLLDILIVLSPSIFLGWELKRWHSASITPRMAI